MMNHEIAPDTGHHSQTDAGELPGGPISDPTAAAAEVQTETPFGVRYCRHLFDST